MRNHSLALDVSLDCVEKLALMQEEISPWLEQHGARPAWADAAAMRVGLVSLDAVDDAMLMGIADSVERVTTNLVPFRISVRGLRCVPETGPRVVLAPITMGGELVDGLRKVIGTHLEKLGLAAEDREFIPSVFVGRLLAPSGRAGALPAEMGAYDFGDSQVRSVVLLRHELTAREATTLVYKRFPLGDPSDR